MRSHLGLVGILLSTVLYASSQEEEMLSVQSGVYTEEQAERGTRLFEEKCRSCHKPEQFANGGYVEGWSGMTADDMIEQIRATMPEDNPGSLKRGEYVDVAAYLFQMNGFPTGDTEMDVESTKRIRIEGPFHSGSN
jgi:mono/diheme cytochrome c family protein